MMEYRQKMVEENEIMAQAAGQGQHTILQVLPALGTGGAERGCVDVAAAQVAAGHIALVASAGGPLLRELERAGAHHITLPLASKNPLVIRRNTFELMDVIAANGVDLVHARSRAPAWSAYRAAQRCDIPYMTTFHAPYNIGNPLKRYYNSVMARGSRVIAISHFIHDHIVSNYDQRYGLDSNRIRIIPRGIELAHFSPERVSPQRIMQLANAWRLPDGVPVVLLPGRLTRWKGQTVLLDALAQLGRQDIACVLVGSDQGRTHFRKELEAQTRRLGLEGVVHIVDHCSDMPAAYMLSDVVVSASTDPEAFGRVIVEAQAMGRPAIVTNHGAVAETVIPGQTAWTIPPADAGALAGALAQALDLTPEQRAILAGRGRRHVEATFTRERMCAATLAVYDELLAEHAAARRAP